MRDMRRNGDSSNLGLLKSEHSERTADPELGTECMHAWYCMVQHQQQPAQSQNREPHGDGEHFSTLY